LIVIPHSNADVDALVSAYLISKFYNARIVVPDEPNTLAKKLANKFGIKWHCELGEEDIWVVDASNPNQLGRFSDIQAKVWIDHHPMGNYRAEKVYFKPYPSCVEVVLDFINEDLGRVELDRNDAFLILSAIYTDTASLKTAKPRTLRFIAEIMEKYNVDIASVYEEIHLPQETAEKIAIMKGMQRVMFREKGGKIVAMSIVGAYESSLAKLLISAGASVAIVASEKKGEVRVIGRASQSSGINILEIFKQICEDFKCESFGGHESAAGLKCSMCDAEAILNALAQRALEEI